MKHIFVAALLAIGFTSNAQSNEPPNFLALPPNMSDTLLAKFFNTEELQEIILTKTIFYHCAFPNKEHVFDVIGDQEALALLKRANSIAVEKTDVSHWDGWDVMVFYFADNTYFYAAIKEHGRGTGDFVLSGALQVKRKEDS